MKTFLVIHSKQYIDQLDNFVNIDRKRFTSHGQKKIY